MLAQLDASGVSQNENFQPNFIVSNIARTSASDLAYDSLISKGWNLGIGETFFAPYTTPVKGYITFDWDGVDTRYITFPNLTTSTTYYRLKDASGNIQFNTWNSFDLTKGVSEFWSVDQFGRPDGSFEIIEASSEFIFSIDVDNLTSLTRLYVGYSQISTIDVSILIGLNSFECRHNSKLVSITGLNLLVNLENLHLRECDKLTSVDTSGLESLTTLYLDSNSSLLDIDISTFSSLTSLTIYNQNFETPKHLDVHTNINNISYNYFRTFTSADLDTLLVELDANGQSNGTLSTGYVARTEASDVSFNNLQSKGWNLGLGSYFIGPNEAPDKAYLRFEETSVNKSIQFSVSSNTGYFVVRYPNGSFETKTDNGVYYTFNSSIPASERVLEIYGSDQFGRPTDSITYLGSLIDCSSIDVSALKHLDNLDIANNQTITTLDFDGLVGLKNISAYLCPLLETVSIVGCTAPKYSFNFFSCPRLDIDAFLIQLDQTGSIPEIGNWYGVVDANQNWGGGFTPVRSHASDAATESLKSKGFRINVFEPAGDIIEIITHGTAPRESWANTDDFYFGIEFISSSGYAKIVFDSGTEYANQYPDGLVRNGTSWDSTIINPNFNGLFSDNPYGLASQKMRIFSCTDDGTPSGEIRSLKISGWARIFGSYSDLTKLKGLSLDTKAIKAQNASFSLTGLNLEYIEIAHQLWTLQNQGSYISSIDLSSHSNLKAFSYIGTFDLDNPGTSVTGIDFTKLEYIQAQGFDFENATLSGFTKINYLFIDSAIRLVGIDFEGSMTKSHVNSLLEGYTEQFLTENPQYKQLQYFRISGLDSNNKVSLSNIDAIALPQSILISQCNLLGNTDLVNVHNYSNWTILNTNVTSISGLGLVGIEFGYCNELTSVSLSNGDFRDLRIYDCASLQSLSIVRDPNNQSNISDFNVRNCPQLTSISVSIYQINYITLQNLDLLNSVDFIFHPSEFYTLTIKNCPSFTNPEGNNWQSMIANVRYLFIENTPLSIDLSLNTNRISILHINGINSISGLSNKPFQDVEIQNMSITSLNFSNSFVNGERLLLRNIQGLTSLNVNNTKLRHLWLYGTTTQNMSTSAMVDSLINALDAAQRYYGQFYFSGFHALKTAASATAYTNLVNKNYNLMS
jgi:hypothetical protein